MATINQLSAITDVSVSDLMVVYSQDNGDARKLSLSNLLSFFESNFASPEFSTQLYVSISGFSIAISSSPSSNKWVLIQPAGALATGTIVLPLNTETVDGTEVMVTSTQTITTLTVSGNGAAQLYGAPTTITGGSFFKMRYYANTNSWYRVG